MAGRTEMGILPECYHLCNCERENVSNYVFNKRVLQKGRGQSWSQAAALEMAEDNVMHHFKRGGGSVAPLPPM